MADETEKELTTYSKAGHIFEEVIGSFRTVLSLNGSEFEQKRSVFFAFLSLRDIFLSFRYAKEMKKTRWNAMKKGGVFGIFMSWTYFIAYLIYFAAFMLISHIITIHQCPNFNITDKIVVSIEQKTFTFEEFQSLIDDTGAFTIDRSHCLYSESRSCFSISWRSLGCIQRRP